MNSDNNFNAQVGYNAGITFLKFLFITLSLFGISQIRSSVRILFTQIAVSLFMVFINCICVHFVFNYMYDTNINIINIFITVISSSLKAICTFTFLFCEFMNLFHKKYAVYYLYS